MTTKLNPRAQQPVRFRVLPPRRKLVRGAFYFGLTLLAALPWQTQSLHAFQQHTVRGEHLKEATITHRKASGTQQPQKWRVWRIREGGKTVGAGRTRR